MTMKFFVAVIAALLSVAAAMPQDPTSAAAVPVVAGTCPKSFDRPIEPKIAYFVRGPEFTSCLAAFQHDEKKPPIWTIGEVKGLDVCKAEHFEKGAHLCSYTQAVLHEIFQLQHGHEDPEAVFNFDKIKFEDYFPKLDSDFIEDFCFVCPKPN